MALFLIIPLSSVILFVLAANGDQIRVRISPPTDSYQVDVFCIQHHNHPNGTTQWIVDQKLGAGIQPIGQQQVLLDLPDLRECLENNFYFIIRSTNKDRYGHTKQYGQIYLNLAHLEQTNNILEISVDKTNNVPVATALPSYVSSPHLVTFYCFVASADGQRRNDQKSFLLFGNVFYWSCDGQVDEIRLNQLDKRHACLGQEIFADVYAWDVGLIKKKRITVAEFDKVIDAKFVEFDKMYGEEEAQIQKDPV